MLLLEYSKSIVKRQLLRDYVHFQIYPRLNFILTVVTNSSLQIHPRHALQNFNIAGCGQMIGHHPPLLLQHLLNIFFLGGIESIKRQ